MREIFLFVKSMVYQWFSELWTEIRMCEYEFKDIWIVCHCSGIYAIGNVSHSIGQWLIVLIVGKHMHEEKNKQWKNGDQESLQNHTIVVTFVSFSSEQQQQPQKQFFEGTWLSFHFNYLWSSFSFFSNTKWA